MKTLSQTLDWVDWQDVADAVVEHEPLRPTRATALSITGHIQPALSGWYAAPNVQLGPGVYVSGAPAEAWAALDESTMIVATHGTAADWNEQAIAIREQLKSALGHRQDIQDIRARLRNLEAAATSILDAIKARRTCIWVPLESLAPAPFRAKRPLTLVVSGSEDGFEASSFDLDLHGSGDTEGEALLDLKDVILETYERLTELDDEQLGPAQLRKKQLLSELIERVPG